MLLILSLQTVKFYPRHIAPPQLFFYRLGPAGKLCALADSEAEEVFQI